MIRTAGSGDLEALVAGNLALALESEDLQLDAATVRAGVRAVLDGAADGAGEYFVFEEEGAIVAQLLVTHEWSDWRNREVWWVQSVYVQPRARRRGLFRLLYHHVEEIARRREVAGIRLYVDRRNLGAQAVYRALGMQGEHYQVFEQMFDDPTGDGSA